MADRTLNRREFLYVSYSLAGGAFLAACRAGKLEPTPTRSAAAGIYLDGSNSDAWNYTKLVTGSLKNPDACRAVWIDNDGTRLPALL